MITYTESKILKKRVLNIVQYRNIAENMSGISYNIVTSKTCLISPCGRKIKYWLTDWVQTETLPAACSLPMQSISLSRYPPPTTTLPPPPTPQTHHPPGSEVSATLSLPSVYYKSILSRRNLFKFKFRLKKKNFNYPTRGNFVVVMAGL